MTLSKETIGSVIEKLEHFAQNLKWTDVRGAQDLLSAADGLRELLERRERDKQEPAPQIKNLEHFIAFWRKVQGGHILPSKNDIDHTVWFMEGLADIAAPPAPVVPDPIEPDYDVIKGILPTSNPDEYACCIAADMWNACRAAMLQSFGNSEQLKPVSQPYTLRDGLAAIRKLGPIDAEKIQAERDALNSPAAPDGWVAVPARHTSAMYYAGGELISKHNFNPGDIWQAMLAAAPKQESE